MIFNYEIFVEEMSMAPLYHAIEFKKGKYDKGSFPYADTNIGNLIQLIPILFGANP